MPEKRTIPAYYFSAEWKKLRTLVVKRDNYTCQYCGTRPAYQADHIKPRSKGGPDHVSNLCCCCQSCNRIAGGREFINIEEKRKYIQKYRKAKRAKKKKKRWLKIFGDWSQ